MRKEKDFVLIEDIIIPKGTILTTAPTNRGGEHYRECVVGIGNDFTGTFSVTKEGIEDANGLIIETK